MIRRGDRPRADRKTMGTTLNAATTLRGQLDAVGFRALLRFLCDLNVPGRVELLSTPWEGQLFVADGRVVAAFMADKCGVDALEAMQLTMSTGEFTFREGLTVNEPNVELTSDQLIQRLDAIAHLTRAYPSLTAKAVPSVAHTFGTDLDVMLTLPAIQVLMAVDGVRSVYDLSTRFGVVPTLGHLVALNKLGLVEFQDHAAARPITRTVTTVTPAAERRSWRSAAITQRLMTLMARAALGVVVPAVVLIGAILVTNRSAPSLPQVVPATVPATVPALAPTLAPEIAPSPTTVRRPANLSLAERNGTAPPATWEADALGPSPPDTSSVTLTRSWTSNQPYRLTVETPGTFVALGAAVPEAVSDASVWASFKKVGGPSGGGYGLIIRDQGPGPRDGTNQSGMFYVFEVSDRSEVGAWRRDLDRWVTISPWASSPAVHPGPATNRLRLDAFGDHFIFFVNGVQVLALTDGTLVSGQVGAFAGGDQTDVLLEGLVVATP